MKKDRFKKTENSTGSLGAYRLLGIFTNDRTGSFMISVLAVVASLLFGSVILILLGKNPFSIYYAFLQGSGLAPKQSYAAYKNIFTDLTSMLDALTPMIFAALAISIAFKGGLFNICVSGQMLFSGFIATILIGYRSLPMAVALPLVIVVGAISGGAVGALIGVLKHRFNINEVVSSIMLNYIIMYIVGFFIQTRYLDPISRQSKNIVPSSRLTLTNVEAFGLKLDIPLGIGVALLFVIGLWYFMKKTRVGYEILIVGANQKAARYIGVNVGRRIVQTMALSGAIAGVAGVTFYLGYYSSIPFNTLNSEGFTAISVALLGNTNPIGVVFSSLLITTITKGSAYMSSVAGVRQEIASVLTGIILLFTACSIYFGQLIRNTQEREQERRKEKNNG